MWVCLCVPCMTSTVSLSDRLQPSCGLIAEWHVCRRLLVARLWVLLRYLAMLLLASLRRMLLSCALVVVRRLKVRLSLVVTPLKCWAPMLPLSDLAPLRTGL